MKTFTFKATEDELIALIHHHANKIVTKSVAALWTNGEHPSTELSERLHFLTKKLHKDTPDVDADTDALNLANQGKQKQEPVAETKPAPANW